MPTKGYDIFQFDPGFAEEMKCRVCGATCDVQRNIEEPTSFGGAMLQTKHLCDFFACPHREEPLHNKGLALMQEMERTYSPSLKKIMQGDLDTIVSQIRCDDLDVQLLENE